jgi:hypothetical protein
VVVKGDKLNSKIPASGRSRSRMNGGGDLVLIPWRQIVVHQNMG